LCFTHGQSLPKPGRRRDDGDTIACPVARDIAGAARLVLARQRLPAFRGAGAFSS
jgi:hypothetical protein